MKAILIRAQGGRENLRLEEIEKPSPDSGEILVKVKACSLNYLDIFVRRGMPGLPVDLPRIGGGDIAGEIEEIGLGVNNLSLGDRILIDPAIQLPDGQIGALGENANGGLTEYITISAENAIPLPDAVSFEDAAALPIAYGTAWRMLHTRGQLKTGESIFILGASGGVGTAAIQIAKSVGCVVYAGSGSDEKLKRLESLGADYGVNTSKNEEFHRTIRGMTNGEGVDVVVNYTGGETWVRALKTLKHGGRLLTCGATIGFDPPTDIRYIWRKEMNILGSDGWRRSDLVDLINAVSNGQIIPIIDKVLPLDETAEGHRLLEEREVFGKVIIQP
ncbi:zinc-binding dehydrogenase [Chloroflexi bacterium]|nr:zinc-binding dehydrogenase [Chloroflexota bacterium]